MCDRKKKRVKLRCLVEGCARTFDDDYRKTHNRQFHSALINSRKNIPFETVGAQEPSKFFANKSSTSSASTSSAGEFLFFQELKIEVYISVSCLVKLCTNDEMHMFSEF